LGATQTAEVEPVDLLVAGVGFVGGYVMTVAEQSGLRVVGVDNGPHSQSASALGPMALGGILACDLRDRRSTAQLFSRLQPRNLVITARLGEGPDCSALEDLVATAAQAGVATVVHISSLAVYGSANDVSGLSEETAPINPSTYGSEKLAEEAAITASSAMNGVRPLILRSTGLFGRLPAPRSSARSAAAIDRLIRQYLRRDRLVLTIEDAADQYLYARELAVVVLEALRTPPQFTVVNVGPGQLLSPLDVREHLQATFDAPVDLELVPVVGRSIGLLSVSRLDGWLPERAASRAAFTEGLRAALLDFGVEGLDG
jgi:nucleoside-diphosphate-sugar epimerase